MPDIHDMTLDALPDWNDVYSDVFCAEHGDDEVREITVFYTDVSTKKKHSKDVRFCMKCVWEYPGEDQEMYTSIIKAHIKQQRKDNYG
tara:strand:+ start:239 stop:502 length:264 start_codon:yes stop_codon:yes gene_type:complete